MSESGGFFGFNLDDEWDDFWDVLERVQDGKAGHQVAFRGETAEEAADRMLEKIRPFILQSLYPSDENGREVES